jgi:hypothetical protein
LFQRSFEKTPLLPEISLQKFTAPLGGISFLESCPWGPEKEIQPTAYAFFPAFEVMAFPEPSPLGGKSSNDSM